MKPNNLFSSACLAFVLSSHVGAVEEFSDDFMKPLDVAWKVTDGNWSLRSGVVLAEGRFSRLERKDFTIQDVEVTADVATLHDQPHASAGIQVRLNDDGTGYAIGLREVERGVDPQHGPWERPLIQLFRVENGGWKLLQEAKVLKYRPGEPRRICVRCEGPDLYVFYDDMENPVIREYDDTYVKAGRVALWKDQPGSAVFDNVDIRPPTPVTGPAPSRADWSWVRGAIYVRSDAVNSVEMWHDYWDHVETVDRELGYARTYGFNMIQVYLHWIVWDKDGAEEYLKRIDDFLARCDRHGLKANLIFWDDCGHVEPSLEFAKPVPGRHNSQMMMNPSHRIRDSRSELEAREALFKDYVTGIATRFKSDRRISFWQLYNEAMGAKETYRTSETDGNIDTLMNWTRNWVKSTGTEIPVTATYGGFQGAKYSDFPTYHSYCAEGQSLPNADGGPEHLCTETLNRPYAGMEKIMTDIVGKKNGFVIWELMVGRDNCRYPWGHPDGQDEPAVPFHGLIYPDGHLWDIGEVRSMVGAEAFAKLGVFQTTYYKGRFAEELKKSITPCIDFQLGDESGTGSPDASAGVPKDDFSIHWSGRFTAPETGEFTFHITTDGEVKMTVDGREPWQGKGNSEHKVSLEKGKAYPLDVRYHHLSGDARMCLKWSCGTSKNQVLKPDDSRVMK